MCPVAGLEATKVSDNRMLKIRIWVNILTFNFSFTNFFCLLVSGFGIMVFKFCSVTVEFEVNFGIVGLTVRDRPFISLQRRNLIELPIK